MTRAAPRFLLAALVATLAVLGDAHEALAQQQEPSDPSSLSRKDAKFVWEKAILRATYTFREVINAPAPLASKLNDGLAHTIAMRAYVWRDGDGSPLDLVARSCRIVYDLWDEVYRIEVTDRSGQHNTAAINADGVARQCAEVREFAVSDRSLLPVGSSYFLAVIVDVDPVSPQMLAQLRAWVTRPTGSTGISPGNAIFGSFAALFVRNIGGSLQTLQFRTTSFVP
jgi:hypothetical protein